MALEATDVERQQAVSDESSGEPNVAGAECRQCNLIIEAPHWDSLVMEVAVA